MSVENDMIKKLKVEKSKHTSFLKKIDFGELGEQSQPFVVDPFSRSF